MSTSTATRVKALCFILLLAGSEAARVQNNLAVKKALKSAADGPEDTWKELNKDMCAWDWSHLKCRNSDASAACKYRPLPLDVTYSQSCRLSDNEMLKDTEQYYGLQAEILEAKANKFAKDCQSVNLFNVVGSMRCKRRVQHMMRAMTFMNKAEVLNKTSTIPEADVKSAKEAMKESLTVLAGSIGEDGTTVLSLMEKVKKSSALREDPSGTMGKSTKLLWALLMGSDAEKEEARKEMETLAEADPTTVYNPPSEEDLLHARASGKQTVDALEDLEISVENAKDGEGDGAVSSLLQQVEAGQQLSLNANGMPKLIKFLIQFMLFMVIAFVMYHFLMEYVFEEVLAEIFKRGVTSGLQGNAAGAHKMAELTYKLTVTHYEKIKGAAMMVSAFVGLGGSTVLTPVVTED